MDTDTLVNVLYGIATFLPPPFNIIALGVGVGGAVAYAALRKKPVAPIEKNPYDKS